MYFTLTLIKEIKIFKPMADESCTNDDNGARFGFLWFGMEGDTYNVFTPPMFSYIFSNLSPGIVMHAYIYAHIYKFAQRSCCLVKM